MADHKDYRDAYRAELDHIDSDRFDYATIDVIFRSLMDDADRTETSDAPASLARILYARAAAYAQSGAR